MSGRVSQDRALLQTLELSLANLRQAWPFEWPGLPLVFERCWQQLGYNKLGNGVRTQALLRLGVNISHAIEQDGLVLHQAGREPRYHNRRHVADALVCMTCLLMAARQQRVRGAGVVHREALMLVVMAGHDFKHPGGRNAYCAQLETLSIEALEPLVCEAALVRADRDDLVATILATDPEGVKPLHAAMAGRHFDLDDLNWRCVLAQEADIMASTLPQTQDELTRSLSQEWAASCPAEALQLLQPESRLGFLEHAALFTSPAASSLGLQEIKSRQIDVLKRRLKF